MFGVFGLLTARHWSWLKSGVGQGVFFVSLGLIVWGIGQAAWTYFLFRYPNQQSPPSHILDIIDLSALPIWFYGIVRLSKATGAKYGVRKMKAKIAVGCSALAVMVAASYFSVVVASGGLSYFSEPFWKAFFDVSYPVGDAVILTIALTIYGLSWKLLGGRFKRPIVIILMAFVVLYVADFSFAYTDVRNTYFNGDWPDLMFLIMIGMLGLALSLLDPTRLRIFSPAGKSVPEPAQDLLIQTAPPQDQTSTPQLSQPVMMGQTAQPDTEPIINPLSQELLASSDTLPPPPPPPDAGITPNEDNASQAVHNETNNQQENY